MNELAQPVWGGPEVIAPVVLGDAAVSFSRISGTLSAIFTGMTANLEEASDRQVACAAVHLLLPFSTSAESPVTLQGQLRGSLSSSGTAVAQVSFLAGSAAKVFDLSREQGDWSLDLTLEASSWTGVCTAFAVVARGSARETAILTLDTLDLVANVKMPDQLS